MSDTGGRRLGSTESFDANANRITQPTSHSILLAARSSNSASSEHQAPAFRRASPKLRQQSTNTHQAPCYCGKDQCTPTVGNHRQLFSRWNDRGFRRGRPRGVSTSDELEFREYFTRAHAIGLAPLRTCGGLTRERGNMCILSRHGALPAPLPGTPEAW